MKQREGFTLIELMIVIAIIAIIAAIAIPGLLRARMSANERSASASLRSVMNAEETLRSTDADADGNNNFWTGDMAGLYFLTNDATAAGVSIKVIQDMGLAYADLNPLPAGTYDNAYTASVPDATKSAPKSGYWYGSLSGVRSPEHGESYAFLAVPSRSGRTGSNCFLVGEDGSIFRRDWEAFSGETQVDATEIAKVDGALAAYPDDATLSADWSAVQ